MAFSPQFCANSKFGDLRNDAFFFSSDLLREVAHARTGRQMSMKALKVQESFDFVGEKSVKEQVCSVAVVHVVTSAYITSHRERAREARDSVTRATICRQERAIEKCENLCDSLVKIIKTDVLNVETGQNVSVGVRVVCVCSRCRAEGKMCVCVVYVCAQCRGGSLFSYTAQL